VNRGFDLWQNGTRAFRSKDYVAAEDHLLAAYQAYTVDQATQSPNTFDPRWGVCCTLAKVYRATARYEDAIRILEKCAPFQAAFGELVRIFRVLAKAAKREGDGSGCAEWYRKMYCIAQLNASISTMRRADMPAVMDYERAAKFLAEIKRQYGTIYSFRWDGRKVPNDSLLSASDYKALDSLSLA
jgi:hypothetical protein